jgi:hypothetical protein
MMISHARSGAGAQKASALAALDLLLACERPTHGHFALRTASACQRNTNADSRGCTPYIHPPAAQQSRRRQPGAPAAPLPAAGLRQAPGVTQPGRCCCVPGVPSRDARRTACLRYVDADVQPQLRGFHARGTCCVWAGQAISQLVVLSSADARRPAGSARPAGAGAAFVMPACGCRPLRAPTHLLRTTKCSVLASTCVRCSLTVQPNGAA